MKIPYINNCTPVKAYVADGNTVISVDCKKKENIGNFKNNGAEYTHKKAPIKVLDHDFTLPENGKAVPYGGYDIINNEGYVNVGISKDTAEFAVQSIRNWWSLMGRKNSLKQRHCLLQLMAAVATVRAADCGKQNCRLFPTKSAFQLKCPIFLQALQNGIRLSIDYSARLVKTGEEGLWKQLRLSTTLFHLQQRKPG